LVFHFGDVHHHVWNVGVCAHLEETTM